MIFVENGIGRSALCCLCALVIAAGLFVMPATGAAGEVDSGDEHAGRTLGDAGVHLGVHSRFPFAVGLSLMGVGHFSDFVAVTGRIERNSVNHEHDQYDVIPMTAGLRAQLPLGSAMVSFGSEMGAQHLSGSRHAGSTELDGAEFVWGFRFALEYFSSIGVGLGLDIDYHRGDQHTGLGVGLKLGYEF